MIIISRNVRGEEKSGSSGLYGVGDAVQQMIQHHIRKIGDVVEE